MKAAVVREPFGLDNLKIENLPFPTGSDENALVKIDLVGVNPVDLNVVLKKVLYGIAPIPHIPGAEAIGTVLEDSNSFRKGDKVVIFPRFFDGTCNMCSKGREYLCEKGSLLGVGVNGAFCEAISLPETNLVRYPDSISRELAATLSVGALTPYHALKRVNAAPGSRLLVYGGSGNTGLLALQLGEMMGLEVSAVSSKPWVARFLNGKLFAAEDEVTGMYDVILNSLGSVHFKSSLSHLAPGGSVVTFGTLTGRSSELDLGSLYTRENSVVGATGGSRSELLEMLKMLEYRKMEAPVEATYPLERIREALEHFQKRSSGRILVSVPQ